jgi:hypothetical protein
MTFDLIDLAVTGFAKKLGLLPEIPLVFIPFLSERSRLGKSSLHRFPDARKNFFLMGGDNRKIQKLKN